MRPRSTKTHHSTNPQVCWPSPTRRDSSTPSDGRHHSGFTHSGKSSAGIASERGGLPPPPAGSVVRTSLASSAHQALDSFLRRSRRVSRHERAASSTSVNVQERACAETFGRSACQDVDENLYEEVQLAPLISRSSSFAVRDASPSIARSQSLERLRETMDSFDNVGKMKRYFERRSESVANAERQQHQGDDRDLHRDRHRRHHYGCHHHQLDDDCSGGDPSASADSSSLSSFSDVYGKGSTRSEQRRRRSRGVAGADSPLEERSLKSPYFLGGEDNSPARWDPELEGRFTWNARETSLEEPMRLNRTTSMGRKGCLRATLQRSESEDNIVSAQSLNHKLGSLSEARASSLERLTSRLKLRDKVNRLATTAFDGKIQTEEADVSWQRPWERYKQQHQQGQQDHQRRQQEERLSRHLSRDTPWMPRDQHLASRHIGHGQAKDLVLGQRHRDHY
ncbi:unnamed protein product [Lampetra planeri]